MSKNKETSKAIDVLLYSIAIGSVTGAMLVAPNAVQILDKPLTKLFDTLDDRQRQRELSRLRSYLKTQGLVRGDYDHGIVLTKKALKRLEVYKFNSLEIECPDKWDNRWRIVMFDIPETKREGRVMFTRRLQDLGFQLLQQSVWIHPYEAKDVVYIVARHFGVEEFVTYIETSHIDNNRILEQRFKSVLKSV
ncbi:hypothetical protein KBB49_01165 [Candidatus Saccharibacteria bacterium]|jgi:hypothetical protein|nr:hypothetical protein [Candidatus Saccharibacteria bacterium]